MFRCLRFRVEGLGIYSLGLGSETSGLGSESWDLQYIVLGLGIQGLVLLDQGYRKDVPGPPKYAE